MGERRLSRKCWGVHAALRKSWQAKWGGPGQRFPLEEACVGQESPHHAQVLAESTPRRVRPQGEPKSVAAGGCLIADNLCSTFSLRELGSTRTGLPWSQSRVSNIGPCRCPQTHLLKLHDIDSGSSYGASGVGYILLLLTTLCIRYFPLLRTTSASHLVTWLTPLSVGLVFICLFPTIRLSSLRADCLCCSYIHALLESTSPWTWWECNKWWIVT